jgi:hypothetical protein
MHTATILDQGVRCRNVQPFRAGRCYREPRLASITKHAHDLPGFGRSIPCAGPLHRARRSTSATATAATAADRGASASSSSTTAGQNARATTRPSSPPSTAIATRVPTSATTRVSPTLLIVTTSERADARFAYQVYLAHQRHGGTPLSIFLTTTSRIEACPEGVLGPIWRSAVDPWAAEPARSAGCHASLRPGLTRVAELRVPAVGRSSSTSVTSVRGRTI